MPWEKITCAKAAVDRGTRCKDEAVGLASLRHRAAGAVRALRARIPCGTHASRAARTLRTATVAPCSTRVASTDGATWTRCTRSRH